MAAKNIGIKEEVYERLKAHKRGDESFSETLDRLLVELDSDWRMNTGFLTQQEADDLEAAVKQGFANLDAAFDEDGDGIDERFAGES